MTGEVEKAEENDLEQEQDDFESSFNEMAQVKDGANDDAIPDDIDVNAEIDAAAVEVAEKEPEKKEDEVSAAEEPVKAEEENLFEGWPQEAIDRYNAQVAETGKLQHRVDSDNGRVRAFQGQVADLNKKIEEITAGGGDQPSKEQIAEAMTTDEGWKQFSEDYPDIANVMDTRFEQMNTATQSQLNETLAPVIEKQRTETIAAEEVAQEEAYGEVAKTYPEWQNAVKEQEFHDWMVAQPPGVQALAASDDTRDASLLIGQYDDHRVANGLQSLKADHENPVVDKKEPTDLELKRAQQLEDGNVIPSKPARISTDASADTEFEAAFNVYAARQAAKA